MSGPNPDFWQERFTQGETPWDRGAPHPQLLHWLAAGLIQPGMRVLIPGCGRGHELVALGHQNIAALGLDYTPAAVALARAQLGSLPGAVALADVLEWQPPEALDIVYEQTCLCALHPDHWQRYAAQIHAWLKPGGQLLALFMQARRDSAGTGVVEGPPYHCDINAMRALFPAALWHWPAPPYVSQAHARGWNELAVVLTRR
ncbi:methyltransferase domain-containing protein [Roseateles koreensis]|uniref:Methyltransferase domain-containing protein n=1 Tax=Roseateles koreensis TaxID=2987526 RepID=A0ABT5KNS0_9BURK|nr:methyltransferase domain-containing protein [Roseateles koreensis]MDC8784558.1 methyltransferase domain-containing protein [Roseateles koreensis]